MHEFLKRNKGKKVIVGLTHGGGANEGIILRVEGNLLTFEGEDHGATFEIAIPINNILTVAIKKEIPAETPPTDEE